MVDLDHPRTPDVFAASRQLDLILDCCPRCLGIVRPGLRRLCSCEEGFGTDAI
jgi:hypothetical protein